MKNVLTLKRGFSYRVNKKALSLFAVLLSLPFFSFAQSGVHRSEAWIAQYAVDKLFYAEGYTLLTGDALSYVSRFTGSGVPVDPETGIASTSWPAIDGIVYCAIPDGEGGWYAGGNFSYADTVKVSNIVHLRANGTVNRDWKPKPNGSVRAIALVENTLFIGGNFTKINTETRNFAGAVNVNTANPLTWNPNFNGAVYTFAISDNLLFAGGAFTLVSDQSRTRLASFDLSNGMATSWAPAVSHTVLSLAPHAASNTIFIGGNFTSAGGSSRIKLARIWTNTTEGLATPWTADLNPEGVVRKLILKDNTLIVAGNFATVSGTPKNAIAGIDINTNSDNVSDWNAGVTNGDVETLGLIGNMVYIGGSFNAVQDIAREGIAAVDFLTGELNETWDPSPNNGVNVIAIANDHVFIGGEFNGLQKKDRTNIVIFRNDTNEPLPFDIDLGGGKIYAMAVAGSTLYFGGAFSNVNGIPRKNLAAMNLTNGSLLDWAPAVNGAGFTDVSSVRCMEIHHELLYIGGQFFSVTTDGVTVQRHGLASLSLTSGTPTAWTPVVGDGVTNSQLVYSLDIKENTVYFGGTFSVVNGSDRTMIAAVDAATGDLLPWAPQISAGVITKLAVSENVAFVKGDFPGTIGGASRNRGIAGIDLGTGLATTWNPIVIGTVHDFALTTSEIFISGDFDIIDWETRSYIASFQLSDGTLTNWTANIRRTGEAIPQVTALAVSPNRLHAAGWFEYLGFENRNSYAEYDLCGTISPLTLTGNILSAPSGQNYQWYMNDVLVGGATSQTFEINPIEYGEYAVDVTLNGCTVRSEDYIYLVTSQERDPRKMFSVYPNPVSETLFIEVPSHSRLTVLDITGRPVKTAMLAAMTLNNIDTSALSNGTYFLRISSSNHQYTFKIIKSN